MTSPHDSNPALSQKPERESRWLALALATVIPLVVAVAVERHLAMDGVYLFERIADTGAFMAPTSTRLFASLLTQWPLVLAVNFGIVNVPLLVAIYGLGFLSVFVGSSVACWLALRPGHRGAMALPIWSFLVVTLPVDGALVSESHAMVALVWPALFLLWRDEPWTRTEAILLLACLVPLSLSYEGAITSLPILAAGAWRQWRRACSRGASTRLIRVALLLIGIGIAAAVWGILWPRDSLNRDGFLSAIPYAWSFVQIQFAAVSCLAFLWICRRNAQMLWAWAAALTVAGVTAVLLGNRLAPLSSYAARTLTLSALPFLLLTWPAWFRTFGRWPKGAWPAAVFAVCLFGGASLTRSNEWSRYRDDFRRVLRSERGFTKLEGHAALLADSSNSWTVPLLSLVWSWPCVRSVVLNPEGVWWEPFDPRKELPLVRYLEFEPTFLEINPSATACPGE